MEKQIGKNTLGGGKRMGVDLKTYNRSTHDLSNIWRNTMSPGTLVPFMKSVALPGDIRDIDLEAKVLTHPTVGPLYGSYKLQLDVFTCPIRLYISALHNNSLKVGMNMSKVKLPKMAINMQGEWAKTYTEWGQVNPSSLLSSLGINGFGILTEGESAVTRFNACPLLMYWDIFKNYYANKQEENAYYIGARGFDQLIFIKGRNDDKEEITWYPSQLPAKMNSFYISQDPRPDETISDLLLYMEVGTYTPIQDIDDNDIYIQIEEGGEEITYKKWIDDLKASYPSVEAVKENNRIGLLINVQDAMGAGMSNGMFTWYNCKMTTNEKTLDLISFPLSNIDDMREDILQKPFYQEFIIDDTAQAPYGAILTTSAEAPNAKYSQFGLALKTYQSDLFNNWINTEWIEGSGSINELTAVSTEGGSFTIDALNIAQKVYNMLNRIALSDGTYRSWLETVYTNEYVSRCESPVYEGGLSQEIVFDEVISTAGSTAQGDEPLGSLAGRGGLMKNRKGGSIRIKVDEPSYIMAIVSITPRLDYSQGNDFDMELDNMDDWHKPELDAIGFQDLPASWMAWSERKVSSDGTVTQRSFGKQPAWIEYMTNFNRTKGNFAINDSEAFMVLNRNYTIQSNGEIKDATTYIDPVKYNYVFADTNLDAMNFWVQIGIKDIARRKMSAKIIPNL